MDQADVRMSFFEHLTELRLRIIWSVVAIGLGFLATFYFSERIIEFLARPLREPTDPAGSVPQLAFLAPTEAFWVNMKVAMLTGFLLALPVVLYQVWAFISPGLHPRERRYALPFVLIGTVFFAVGMAFALLVVTPFAITFLLSYKTQGLTPMLSVGRYVDFILKFTFAFGLVFELPLAITVASRLGVVTPQFLAKNRKYAILINFILAAILTPTPDIINQSLMAGPLIILYEVGILAARIFGRKRTPVPPSEEQK
ncbi:MAG: twin-arginine translocase subunit TatC [Candidatus Methylomirabilia bacterium]